MKWTPRQWEIFHRVYAEREKYWEEFPSLYRQDGVIWLRSRRSLSLVPGLGTEEVRDMLAEETPSSA